MMMLQARRLAVCFQFLLLTRRAPFHFPELKNYKQNRAAASWKPL
jgi:hypothetical protein